MLTLKQIVQKTDPVRIANSKFVRIIKFKSGYTPRGTGYAACQSYSTHHYDSKGRRVINPDKTKYVTVVEFLDKKLHVNVSCSCSDFMYSFEVALHKKGAADIEYSNGMSPDVRNPAHTTACCKHLVQLYFRIRNKLVT